MIPSEYCSRQAKLASCDRDVPAMGVMHDGRCVCLAAASQACMGPKIGWAGPYHGPDIKEYQLFLFFWAQGYQLALCEV